MSYPQQHNLKIFFLIIVHHFVFVFAFAFVLLLLLLLLLRFTFAFCFCVFMLSERGVVEESDEVNVQEGEVVFVDFVLFVGPHHDQPPGTRKFSARRSDTQTHKQRKINISPFIHTYIKIINTTSNF